MLHLYLARWPGKIYSLVQSNKSFWIFQQSYLLSITGISTCSSEVNSNKQGVLISRGMEICIKDNKQGGWNIRTGVGCRKMVNRVPLRLVWPSRHLLHRKMTKQKSKEYIKYYFFFMKISNATVTSKQNFIEKYHRLMKNLYN